MQLKQFLVGKTAGIFRDHSPECGLLLPAVRMTRQGLSPSLEDRCKQLKREWLKFNYIRTIIITYLGVKVIAFVGLQDLSPIANHWHKDPFAIVLGAMFGYILICLGVGYLKIALALQDPANSLNDHHEQLICSVPFFGQAKDDLTTGSFLTVSGIAMIAISALQVINLNM